jgi:hypothetical protein
MGVIGGLRASRPGKAIEKYRARDEEDRDELNFSF